MRLLILNQGEPFSETKQRLSEFTKIKGKQLDKIKFVLVSKPQYSRPESVEDGMLIPELYLRKAADML
jgi:ubiquitin carboxyl-terminal hydrolase 7